MRAQQSATTKRVAFVNPSIKVGEMRIGGDSAYAALFVELGRLGYVEGKNLIVDRYLGEGQKDRYGDLARVVVGTHPDCIGSAGTLLTREFNAAKNTIPVVAFTGDLVRFGLISSLAPRRRIMIAQRG